MNMNTASGLVEYRKNMYPKGTRVRAISFATDNSTINDNLSVPAGTEGTVRMVDGMGTVHTDWDNGSKLGALVEDHIEIVS